MDNPMILTVCPNPALDKIIFIEKWTSGTPMRTNKIVTCIGGKGFNSAAALQQLGADTTAIGFFAGKTGDELISALNGYGINTVPVWVDGETRISHVIAETQTQIHNHVITGEIFISPLQKKEFIEKYKLLVQKAKWVIFGGSLPESLPDDFYYEMISYSKKIGVPSLIDSQKNPLIEGIKAFPDIVKLNNDEFEWTFKQKADSEELLIRQSRELKSSLRIKNLVLTLSTEGMLAFTSEGDYRVIPPQQIPVNAAGAGDSASSALVWKLSEGESWQLALQWAAAVSAASVLTERTADFNISDVLKIFPQVQIEKI
jgi:1-phosphofructokinase family hexose kinase